MDDVIDVHGDKGAELVDVDRRRRAWQKRQLGQDSADVRQTCPMLPLAGGGVALETAGAVYQRQHAPTAIAIPPRVVHVVTGTVGTKVSPGVLGALVPARSRGLRVEVVGGSSLLCVTGAGPG